VGLHAGRLDLLGQIWWWHKHGHARRQLSGHAFAMAKCCKVVTMRDCDFTFIFGNCLFSLEVDRKNRDAFPAAVTNVGVMMTEKYD
jgi:hypothetical protein